MKTLVLKNSEASALITIMATVKLSGVRNITRGRCLRMLKAETELFEVERQRLLKEEHANLDEDGNVIEIGGGVSLKSLKGWTEAIKKLNDEALIKIPVATDVDKAWVKLAKEVMTTKLCPELDGQAAMDFEDVLDAINLAIEEPKKVTEEVPE